MAGYSQAMAEPKIKPERKPEPKPGRWARRIGDRLRAARGGERQADFAARAGTDQPSISAYETGRGFTAIERAFEIWTAAGVDVWSAMFEATGPRVVEDPALDEIVEGWSSLPPEIRTVFLDTIRRYRVRSAPGLE